MGSPLEWVDNDGKATSGYRQVEPKPYDQIPVGEQVPRKKLTIQNNLHVRISLGQIASTWDTVNFVVESHQFNSKSIKWLADLEPTDRIELEFKEPVKIEP